MSFLSFLLFFILLTGPDLPLKSPVSRWDVHGSKSPEGSKVSKVVVKLSQSADGRVQNLTSGPEDQQWSSSPDE